MSTGPVSWVAVPRLPSRLARAIAGIGLVAVSLGTPARAADPPPTCTADASFAAVTAMPAPFAGIMVQLLVLEDKAHAAGLPGNNTASATLAGPLGCTFPVPPPPADTVTPAPAPEPEPSQTETPAAPSSLFSDSGSLLADAPVPDVAPDSLAEVAESAAAPIFNTAGEPIPLKQFATWVLVCGTVAAVFVFAAGSVVVGRLRVRPVAP